ncbi:hypothetical protein MTO96_037405 [Rhipicephalus appendiculatus]
MEEVSLCRNKRQIRLPRKGARDHCEQLRYVRTKQLRRLAKTTARGALALAASREKEQKSVQGVARETPGFDSADEALLARIAEQVSAGHVTAGDDSDEQDDATTLSFSSDGGHSDEESTPELGESSEHDRMDEVHRELSRLLGVLREWRSRPPHTTCSPRCTCPLTNRYARAARTAVSLSAFLAFHDRPLPSEGVTDPAVAMTLELFLRRLEQNADVGNGSGSE